MDSGFVTYYSCLHAVSVLRGIRRRNVGIAPHSHRAGFRSCRRHTRELHAVTCSSYRLPDGGWGRLTYVAFFLAANVAQALAVHKMLRAEGGGLQS